MSILCKIFGHRMYFDGCDILGPSHCVRWRCGHKEKAKTKNWPRPPKLKANNLTS